jgi:hypothetical protein
MATSARIVISGYDETNRKIDHRRWYASPDPAVMDDLKDWVWRVLFDPCFLFPPFLDIKRIMEFLFSPSAAGTTCPRIMAVDDDKIPSPQTITTVVLVGCG